MKDNHIPEWKKIKEKYEFMINSGFTIETPQNAIKFRIECIESLINEAGGKDKEIAHFR